MVHAVVSLNAKPHSKRQRRGNLARSIPKFIASYINFRGSPKLGCVAISCGRPSVPKHGLCTLQHGCLSCLFRQKNHWLTREILEETPRHDDFSVGLRVALGRHPHDEPREEVFDLGHCHESRSLGGRAAIGQVPIMHTLCTQANNRGQVGSERGQYPLHSVTSNDAIFIARRYVSPTNAPSTQTIKKEVLKDYPEEGIKISGLLLYRNIGLGPYQSALVSLSCCFIFFF